MILRGYLNLRWYMLAMTMLCNPTTNTLLLLLAVAQWRARGVALQTRWAPRRIVLGRSGSAVLLFN